MIIALWLSVPTLSYFLTSYKRVTAFSPTSFAHLQNLRLADATSIDRDRIDLLIGADLYGPILLEGLRKGSQHEPVAQLTIFGWVVFRPRNSRVSDTPSSSNFYTGTCLLTATYSTVDSELQKFWEIENIPSSASFSEEDQTLKKREP